MIDESGVIITGGPITRATEVEPRVGVRFRVGVGVAVGIVVKVGAVVGVRVSRWGQGLVDPGTRVHALDTTCIRDTTARGAHIIKQEKQKQERPDKPL